MKTNQTFHFLPRFTALLMALACSAAAAPAPIPVDDQLLQCDTLDLDPSAFLAQANSGHFSLVLDGDLIQLELQEFSLSPDGIRTFQFDGKTRIEIPHSQPTSFRGTVLGYPDSHLHLTVCGDRSWVRGYISFDGHMYFIQPRFEETPVSGRSELVVYQQHDVKEAEGSCGTVDAARIAPGAGDMPATGLNRENLFILPVVDPQFVNINPDTWFDRLSAQIGGVASIFLNNNIVAFVAPEYGVYSGSSSYDLNTILNHMTSHFCTSSPGRRHVVHLMSGKEMAGTNFGMARPGIIGRSMGYSVAQCVATTGYSASDYQKVMVSSHEIAHHFGATHDQATTVPHWNILCLFTGYTIMFPNFMGDCTVDYFSGPNATAMQVFCSVLGLGHPGDTGLVINGGDTYTTSPDVQLIGYGPTLYYYANGFLYFGAAGFSNTPNENLPLEQVFQEEIYIMWPLTPGDGPKEVFLYAFDFNDYNLSSTDTIILDTTPPNTVPGLDSSSHQTGQPSTNRTVQVDWQSALDQTSGVAGYSLLWSEDPEAEADETLDVEAEVLATTSAELPNGQWYFTIRAIDRAGLSGIAAQLGPFVIVSASAVGSGHRSVPAAVTLLDNYPDPFNPSTTILFGMPRPGPVRLGVYNVFGQLVRVLVDENREAGFHTEMWDGCNEQGGPVASGIYFYKLTAANVSVSKKMVLIK